MVRELESRGYEVWQSDIAHDPSAPMYGNYYHDALDVFGKITRVFDLIIHAAYHVGGRAAIDGVNTNFAKNLQLDAAMFEWAVRTKQKRVLYFSSSAAYPVVYQTRSYQEAFGALAPLDNPHKWLSEDDIDLADPAEILAPDANYGWAKLTGERLAEDARRNGLHVSVVRPFSGYGEDQSLDYPFPSIVRRAASGDLSVWGPPGQSRDWIHVDDVVRGALAVVESETTDPVNLCTGVATEMGELAEMVFSMANCSQGIPEGCESERGGWDLCEFCDDHEARQRKPNYLEDKPYGVFYRVGDPTRMLQYYTPRVSLEEGIRRALDVQQDL